jgi:uncharacterized protein YaaQ
MTNDLMIIYMSKEIVLTAMKNAGKPLKAGEIVDLTGLDKKQVEKAMKILKDQALITSPKVCYWQAK